MALLSKLDQFSVNFAEYIINKRWFVLCACLLVVLIMANGVRHIGFDTNYRVFFGEDNPQLQAFDQLQRTYSKTDNAIIMIKNFDGNIFEPRIFQLIQDITKEAWQLPYSTRVDSLANFQHTIADGDNLIVRDLIETNGLDVSDADIALINKVGMSEPLLYKRIVSKDGSATGIAVTFNFPEKDVFEVPTTAQAVLDLVDKYQTQHPDLVLKTSGIVLMNNAFSTASQNDMQNLIPIMYLVLLGVMFLLLRSVSATLATLIVIAVSAIGAMGLTGYLGIKLTPPSATAPTVILTLAIADSIHILVTIFKELEQKQPKEYAIIESLRINLQPIFITSLTTIIGFLSLNFSDAPPLRDLGNITAMGIALAFFFSITLLPALIAILPIKAGNKKEEHISFIARYGKFITQHRKKSLVGSTIVILVLASAITLIDVNDEFVKYFDESIAFRTDTDFMIEHLTGIYQAEFSIGANGSNAISDPKYIKGLDSFKNWLTTQEEVMHVYSMSDTYKRLHKNMHADQEHYYRIPENRDLAAQYLLLYEFSLPYGLDLNDRINVSKSSTRLTVTLKELSTKEMRAFKHKSEAWLKRNLPSYMSARATSPTIMFSYISERNINSMIKGNIIALFLISCTILIVLRNIKMGVVSLVPNLVPLIMSFGIWGLFVGQVNMAVAIVSAISLGIIVDDTVHFLSKYHRARVEKGLDATHAVQYSFATVGLALMVTTAILVCGFFVLTFSTFQVNATMGTLTAITILCALIADFVLLPALLMTVDKTKRSPL